MPEYRFTLHLEVRDYECDLQGIVNNAVYQNYLEHARHEFLKVLGIDFASLSRKGVNLVVVRAEIDYLHPLGSGDKFWIGLNMERFSKVRFCFAQDVYRAPDNKPVLRAKIIGTAINEAGRPRLPAEIEKILEAGALPHSL